MMIPSRFRGFKTLFPTLVGIVTIIGTSIATLVALGVCGGDASLISEVPVNTAPTVLATSVQLSPEKATVTEGDSEQFLPTIKDRTGEELTGLSPTW